ncbi:hypothetical protein [Streptomyces tsukubensis]|uniref:hypothetical protein n=1 Tax=Streptomyces tsukubensis TaxID=83656 RepID=UPI00344D6826
MNSTRGASPWPPRSSVPASLLSAYADVLGWPLLADGVPVPADGVLELLEGAPDTVVATRCRDAGVDVIALPLRAGLKTLLRLDKDAAFQPGAAPVPALRGTDNVTLLVRAGTAAALAGLRGILVTTGAGPLRLPPTRGVAWDSPPWHPFLRRPAALPSAEDLRPILDSALPARQQHPHRPASPLLSGLSEERS